MTIRYLEDTISYMFRTSITATIYNRSYTPSVNQDTSHKFISIPTDRDRIEIPLFAINRYISALNGNGVFDYLACELYCDKWESYYKTVDRSMRDLLVTDPDKHLVRLNVKYNNNYIPYYVTLGAVFTSEIVPVMIASWQFNKTSSQDRVFCINMKPVIRVNPHVIINPTDPMEKFIVRKIIPTALNNSINTRGIDTGRAFFPSNYVVPSVYIEESPFSLSMASAPDINTSNQDLLNTVNEHVEEIAL